MIAISLDDPAIKVAENAYAVVGIANFDNRGCHGRSV